MKMKKKQKNKITKDLWEKLCFLVQQKIWKRNINNTKNDKKHQKERQKHENKLTHRD